MAINPVNLRIGTQPNLEGLGQSRRLQAKPGASFSDMISQAVNKVDAAHKESEQMVTDFVAGKTDNVHDVTIAMQRSRMSFELMMEIRNKLLETYKEVSRTQM